jgi:regulatory protein
VPGDPDPLELAARALRHRDRSKADIAGRLARAGIDDERRADALERLEEIGYVDDRRFAARRAEALAARQLGDEAIRHALAEEGVEAAAIVAAVEALEPEAARADAIAARLGRTAKTAARLTRKGFGADAIEHAVGLDFA